MDFDSTRQSKIEAKRPNEQERKQLKIQHKQERDKRVCDRIKAILLHDEGWTPQQIAKVLLISDQAVRNHVDDYQTIPKKTQNLACGCTGILNFEPVCIAPVLTQKLLRRRLRLFKFEAPALSKLQILNHFRYKRLSNQEIMNLQEGLPF